MWTDRLHVTWMPEGGKAHRGEIKPHRHDDLIQILYVRSGEGEVSIENSRQVFHGPCLIFLPCRTVHAFRGVETIFGMQIMAAQRPLEAMARIVEPDLLGLIQQPALMTLPWAADEQDPLWNLLQLLNQEVSNPCAGHMAAGLSLLLTFLIQAARLRTPGRVVPDAGRHGALLAAFRELVDQRYRNHWPLELYAETLGVTLSKLGRVCREELGEPPMSVINSRIMREAQRQLAYADAGVKQIAHDLGFSDVSYFSRYFRKHSGLKPSEFRTSFLERKPGN
jgi:AraC family transcriptional activator of pobA